MPALFKKPAKLSGDLPAAFLAHVQSLPSQRPSDLFLTICLKMANASMKLEYVSLSNDAEVEKILGLLFKEIKTEHHAEILIGPVTSDAMIENIRHGVFVGQWGLKPNAYRLAVKEEGKNVKVEYCRVA